MRTTGKPHRFSASDFDAERVARLDAQNQVHKLTSDLEAEHTLRLAAERQVERMKLNIAEMNDEAKLRERQLGELREQPGIAILLLERALKFTLDIQSPLALRTDINDFLNTTSTEGKDHE